MGLGGTGYLGKQEKHSRAARKRAARRKILEGFPILKPFSSIEDVREYISGDKIICLLCGKSYRRIGTHLQSIHGISCDEYRERYNIPWTYGLICQESSLLYSQNTKKRFENGWEGDLKIGKDHESLISYPKRECPFKREISLLNLGHDPNRKPKEPPSKRGTEEFKRKMRARPQCQPDVTRERIGNYWKGKKQSEEHKRKRFKRFHDQKGKK